MAQCVSEPTETVRVALQELIVEQQRRVEALRKTEAEERRELLSRADRQPFELAPSAGCLDPLQAEMGGECDAAVALAGERLQPGSEVGGEHVPEVSRLTEIGRAHV